MLVTRGQVQVSLPGWQRSPVHNTTHMHAPSALLQLRAHSGVTDVGSICCAAPRYMVLAEGILVQCTHYYSTSIVDAHFSGQPLAYWE
jgi:hypothetical protein